MRFAWALIGLLGGGIGGAFLGGAVWSLGSMRWDMPPPLTCMAIGAVLGAVIGFTSSYQPEG